MIGPIERKPTVRMAGYLEKRGKMRLVVCRWKRWWFVLEGRLLLYYKSQLEYLNLSPCRGSLNMGLAASVRPGKGLELTVITRSQSVTLRAANKRDHEQWLQSLVDAMALSSSPHGFKSRPIQHFRYNDQDQPNSPLGKARRFRSPYTALPSEFSTSRTQSGSCETSTSSSHSSSLGQTQSDKCLLRRVLSDSRTLLQRPYKRPSVHSSARLNKLALSDTSLPVINRGRCQSPTEKCHSLLELRSDIIRSIENLRVSENPCKCVVGKSNEDELVLTGSKDSKLSNSIKIELNLEDISCTKGEIFKEQKIGHIKIVLDGCTIYGSRKFLSDVDDLKGDSFYQNVKEIHINSNKDVKSDTDLSVKRRSRCQSLSCENMQTLDRSIGSTYQDICSRLEFVKRDQRILQIHSDCEPGRKPNRPKRRSNSFLSRLRENKNDEQCGNFERQNTIRKRLSFLRKMWRKREKKVENEEYESIEYESIPVVIELPTPQVQKAEQLLSSLRQEEMGPVPEPPPDYDVSITEEQEVPPMLPPRMGQRPPSPFHDVPRNNRPVELPEHEIPPPLPVKTKNQRHHQQEPETRDLEESGVDSMNCETSSSDEEQKLEEADSMLIQLSEVNRFEVQDILEVTVEADQKNVLQVLSAPEPIYDVPRPHLSLVASIRRQNVRSETFSPTQFLCSTPLIDSDSLDPVIDRLDAEMTPDSLECDSAWSLTQACEVLNSSGSSQTSSLQSHFITTDDRLFPDSLNS